MCQIVTFNHPKYGIVTAFQCSCDPDDPAYLARLYPNEERPESPVGPMIRRMMKRDPVPKAKHVRLRDLSDDGRIYI